MHPIRKKLEGLVERNRDYNPMFVRNVLKEYLQDILLFIIYNDSDLKNLIFYGGSCLRKVYDLNRLSEDIDFESEREIDLSVVSRKIGAWFKKEKFNLVDISTQSSEHINRVTVKLPILYELGLLEHKTEKLHVKVEINEKLSGQYETIFSPYSNNRFSMMVRHYDLETLMAGKMVACIERVFEKGDTGIDIKGRDYYDLIWYMQKDVSPDADRLRDSGYTVAEAFRALDNKVEKIKPSDLLIDLDSLFAEPKFIRGWCGNFHDLYNRYRDQYQQ